MQNTDCAMSTIIIIDMISLADLEREREREREGDRQTDRQTDRQRQRD